MARNPGASVAILSRTSAEIREGIEAQVLDAGITYLDATPPSRLAQVALYHESYRLIELGANTAPLTWAEAAARPLCLLTPDMQNRRIIDAHLAEAGAQVSPRVESNSTIAILAHVAAGPWAAIVPEALAEGAIEAGRGGVMTPGLVDCHSHLVYAGNRAGEFEQRLEGASYAEIAKAGGGILSTVRVTRAASEDELLVQSLPRLQALLDDGVTTLEIKSGYGLSTADELKMLRVARRLGELLPLRITTTLLGAHALPPEFAGDSDGYISLVCNEMIPAAVAEGLVDAVDVFCENIAFSPAQCELVFKAAQRHGLPIKVHAEQLSNQGASALAARYRGLSADHIEFLDEPGVQAMAAAGTVAVLLPGAFYT
ncbi:MAG: imidazolonepropionase, partial [Gammaproteobacteria bacterium HGW-Gammaproteobacteria-7]